MLSFRRSFHFRDVFISRSTTVLISKDKLLIPINIADNKHRLRAAEQCYQVRQGPKWEPRDPKMYRESSQSAPQLHGGGFSKPGWSFWL